MTRTIVTGASGFVGSHLMKRLPDAEALPHEDITVGQHGRIDKLFFLSGYGNMAFHTVNRMMVHANVVDLLPFISKLTGWICYMSTSSATLPVQTPYSRTKRAAEEILQALPELKSCIVRPYSITGVGEQREHLIPALIRSCMEGEIMPFDPAPTHDFIDVEDVVDGLLLLAEREVSGVFEFGNGFPVKNEQVREIVEIVCGKKASVKTVSRIRDYDTTEWFCRKPQFKPSKTIFQSITEMVEAYKREHSTIKQT